MRIKIIGENNCARATRHLLRLAGFAVTEFLPADALVGGPQAGYSITIDLAPATHDLASATHDLAPLTHNLGSASHDLASATHNLSPSTRDLVPATHDLASLTHDLAPPTHDLAPATHSPDSLLRPDSPTHDSHTSGHEEAGPARRDASSPSFAESAGGVSPFAESAAGGTPFAESAAGGTPLAESAAGGRGVTSAYFRSSGGIHFDSVDSALEAAVLRHVAQLAAAPVVVDRPGGVVRSERELRIVLPNTGDAAADEAAAVAVEFGVLRGLLDLTAAACGKTFMGAAEEAPAGFRKVGGWRKWFWFGVVLIFFGVGFLRVGLADGSGRYGMEFAGLGGGGEAHRLKSVSLGDGGGFLEPHRLKSVGLGDGGDLLEPHRLKSVSLEPYSLAPVGLAGLLETHRLKPVALGDGGGLLEIHRLKPVSLEPYRLAPVTLAGLMEIHRLKPAPLEPYSLAPVGLAGLLEPHRLKSVSLEQGQFATGGEFRISDGVNFLIVDPCKGQTKLFASISQTGNTQLAAGTVSKKIYICSIHVVAAAAANVAVVEGTGSVCATGTAGVGGLGGATAATGWNFAANGGIALGNGDSSVGAEGTSGDNLCVFNSGSGQVSGGISYVVQ